MHHRKSIQTVCYWTWFAIALALLNFPTGSQVFVQSSAASHELQKYNGTAWDSCLGQGSVFNDGLECTLPLSLRIKLSSPTSSTVSRSSSGTLSATATALSVQKVSTTAAPKSLLTSLTSQTQAQQTQKIKEPFKPHSPLHPTGSIRSSLRASFAGSSTALPPQASKGGHSEVKSSPISSRPLSSASPITIARTKQATATSISGKTEPTPPSILSRVPASGKVSAPVQSAQSSLVASSIAPPRKSTPPVPTSRGTSAISSSQSPLPIRAPLQSIASPSKSISPPQTNSIRSPSSRLSASSVPYQRVSASTYAHHPALTRFLTRPTAVPVATSSSQQTQPRASSQVVTSRSPSLAIPKSASATRSSSLVPVGKSSFIRPTSSPSSSVLVRVSSSSMPAESSSSRLKSSARPSASASSGVSSQTIKSTSMHPSASVVPLPSSRATSAYPPSVTSLHASSHFSRPSAKSSVFSAIPPSSSTRPSTPVLLPSPTLSINPKPSMSSLSSRTSPSSSSLSKATDKFPLPTSSAKDLSTAGYISSFLPPPSSIPVSSNVRPSSTPVSQSITMTSSPVYRTSTSDTSVMSPPSSTGYSSSNLQSTSSMLTSSIVPSSTTWSSFTPTSQPTTISPGLVDPTSKSEATVMNPTTSASSSVSNSGTRSKTRTATATASPISQPSGAVRTNYRSTSPENVNRASPYVNPGRFSASSSDYVPASIGLSYVNMPVQTIYTTGAEEHSLAGTLGRSFGLGGLQTSWQSSGQLTKGACDRAIVSEALISDCYTMRLSGNASDDLADGYAVARQRIEVYVAGVMDTSRWKYSWKTYLATSSTTSTFFHLWQVLTRGGGSLSGPVVTLSAVGGKAIIQDMVRCPQGCASVDIDQFAYRVIQHQMVIKFGNEGEIAYEATDAVSGVNLLTYNATGFMGNESTSLKFGLYRRANPAMREAIMYFGDFVGNQVN